MARQQFQMGVGFTPEMRERLQRAADAAGHSVAEEIRRRLERTFAQRTTPTRLRLLVDAITRFAGMIKDRTGKDWSSDPSAATLLLQTISLYMGRRYGARLNEKTVLEIGEDIEAADHKVVQALEEALVSTEANIKNILEALPNAGARKEQIEQGLRSLMQQRDALQSMLRSPGDD
jgi:hypothetical protein